MSQKRIYVRNIEKNFFLGEEKIGNAWTVR